MKTAFLGVVLLAALGVFAWAAWALRYVDPPPWPDEAMFADASAHVARYGTLTSDLFRESVPSTARSYHLYPPLYLLLVGGVFAVFGPGLLAMRMTSVAIAVVALALMYGIARRAGLGRAASFGAVSLLAVDLVFMRAAHNGRMELLALLFVMLVVWLGLGPDSMVGGSRTPRIGSRAFGMGLAAGLAFLCHPLGGIAAPIAVVMLVAALAAEGFEPQATLDGPVALLLGGFAALLPWAIYVVQDPDAFGLQFGIQFARKLRETHSGGCVTMTMAQWPIQGPLAYAVLGTALAGLLVAGWRQARARGLLVVELLLIAAVISGCEQWYAVYMVPLAYVGVARMAAIAEEPGPRGLAGVAALIVGVIWASVSVAGLVLLGSGRGPDGGGATYRAWSRQVEQALPRGSTVVLDLVPTPYFGFENDRDLKIRLFRLAGFEQAPEAEGRAMDAFDYVILGAGRGSRALADSVRARGVFVQQIADTTERMYVAKIYRMRKGVDARRALAAIPAPR